MSTSINSRPSHLADFTAPPLNEVVLGIQFSPPIGYQQILAGQVWDLYRTDFPLVQEHPSLDPMFETFGLEFFPQPSFKLSNNNPHSRYWFLTEDESNLIQFQEDRFTHNWRDVPTSQAEYPRFENMLEKFTSEINALESYIESLAPQKLNINQYELIYVNHIYPAPGKALDPNDFFNFATFKTPPEDLGVFFRETIHAQDGRPVGRLSVETTAGFATDGQKIFRLVITARGTPLESNTQSTLQSLTNARELIVNKFENITTDFAHQLWGKTTK